MPSTALVGLFYNFRAEKLPVEGERWRSSPKTHRLPSQSETELTKGRQTIDPNRREAGKTKHEIFCLTMLFRFDWDMLPDCPLLVLDPT